MMTLIGIGVVFGCIAVGYAMHHGNFHVLMQPAEVLIVAGAGCGAVLIMAPPKLLRQLLREVPTVFRGVKHSKQISLEVIGVLYEVLTRIKRDGALAIEKEVETPEESELFRKYPLFLRNHPAVTLFCDTMRLILMGGSIQPHEMDELMTVAIETQEEESHRVSGVLHSLADALPGLGIVAAVLGVIITMGKMDQSPEVIGMSIAAALVGTFMGIFLAYCVVGPIAKQMEHRHQAELKLLEAIKRTLLAFVKDMPPRVAVEFGRQTLYEDDKPEFRELEQALKKRS